MLTNTRVARELGYLDIEEKDLIDAYELSGVPDRQVLVMCTGSQGAPLSALSVSYTHLAAVCSSSFAEEAEVADAGLCRSIDTEGS